MRRELSVLIVSGLLVTVCFGAQPVTETLRKQLRIQEGLLRDELAEMDEHRARLQEAWVRVEREAADLSRAQQQGESLDSLKLRDEDLRQAESELIMHLFALQRLRKSALASEAMIVATEEEIRRLEGQVGSEEDPLSGVWRMVLEPGGLDGFMNLRLDGTLLQGTYSWAGDWSGSFRGTFVSNKVRLEQIDSQIGFAAILHGKLTQRGGKARLEGTWEGTQLAAGLPSSGNWFAERESEQAE
jgi:hypothetical protein